jgi:hypothetical protein
MRTRNQKQKKDWLVHHSYRTLSLVNEQYHELWYCEVLRVFGVSNAMGRQGGIRAMKEIVSVTE